MSRAVGFIAFAFVLSLGALLGLLAGGGLAPLPVPASAPAGSLPSFAEIVERVNPAVVYITVVDNVPSNPHEGIQDAPDIQVPRRGEGSGFVVDPAGYILTNSHLVNATSHIRVRFADKRELPAKLVGTDPNTDVALIKVDAPRLPAVALGDSDRLRVGEWVCAIGNPYSFEHSVTAGVVSSKGRKIFNASFDAYIQTDAAINPGNSGGPLINLAGEAVGINTAVSTEGQGIGFAVPINVAREVMEQLKSEGRVSRGYLGIQLQEMDPDLQRLLKLKEPRGAVVLDVLGDGAGAAAGLKRYDVIVAIAGQPVDDGDHLVHAISARRPGSEVALNVVREGRELVIKARLGERAPDDAEDESATPKGEPHDDRGDGLGLVVNELGRHMRREMRIPPDRTGVVVDDVVGLQSGLDALSRGDLILEVNRRPTPDVEAYRRALASLKAGEPAFLLVYRPRPTNTFLAKLEVEGN